jgi:hypothetical protein
MTAADNEPGRSRAETKTRKSSKSRHWLHYVQVKKHCPRLQADNPKLTRSRSRHVKCDESKPSCRNCLKYSGKCGGYASPNKVHIKKSQHRLVPRPHLRKLEVYGQPMSTIFATEKEHRFYHLFVTKTATSLSGFFESEIWNGIVLQACQTEPSIRHAVIAIGALDMSGMRVQDEKEGRLAFSKKDEATIKDHHFALKQYSKALDAMRAAASDGKQSLRTALLASMLVICFETYQGDYQAALNQIRIGLDLMTSWQQSKPRLLCSSAGTSETLEDELCEAFDRLDTQAMTFVDRRPMSAHEQLMKYYEDELPSMPEVFPSIRSARFYSNVLMRRLMHFRIFWVETHRDTMARAVSPDEVVADPPEEMVLELNKYMADLERWRAAFEPLMKKLARSGNEKEYLSGISLE